MKLIQQLAIRKAAITASTILSDQSGVSQRGAAAPETAERFQSVLSVGLDVGP
jgi:hypothetical protein